MHRFLPRLLLIMCCLLLSIEAMAMKSSVKENLFMLKGFAWSPKLQEIREAAEAEGNIDDSVDVASTAVGYGDDAGPSFETRDRDRLHLGSKFRAAGKKIAKAAKGKTGAYRPMSEKDASRFGYMTLPLVNNAIETEVIPMHKVDAVKDIETSDEDVKRFYLKQLNANNKSNFFPCFGQVQTNKKSKGRLYYWYIWCLLLKEGCRA